MPCIWKRGLKFANAELRLVMRYTLYMEKSLGICQLGSAPRNLVHNVFGKNLGICQHLEVRVPIRCALYMENIWRFANPEVHLVIECALCIEKRLEIFQPGNAPHNRLHLVYLKEVGNLPTHKCAS